MKNNIAKIRKSRGLSQEKLGELVNSTRGQIDNLEKGRRKLTTDWMERIAKALACDPAALISSNYSSKEEKLPSKIDISSLKIFAKAIDRISEVTGIKLSNLDALDCAEELYEYAKRIIQDKEKTSNPHKKEEA